MSAFPYDDPDGPERPPGNVAVLNPAEELADYRPAIEDEDAFGEMLAKCSPEERELLASLVGVARRLGELTEWAPGELLDQLGCPNRDPAKLAKDPHKLNRCTRFLELLLEAAQLVETVRDHRIVVRSCAQLREQARRDADGLRELLETGSVSPLEYIGLGEISTAIRTATVAAKPAQPTSSTGPREPVVHVSGPRLELYARGDRGALGEQTFTRMATHFSHCEPCRDQLAFRRERVESP